MFRKGCSVIALSLFGLVLLLVYARVGMAGGTRTAIAQTRLTQYAQTYPEIYFLHLRSEDMWALGALPELIGSDAINLDYEHDKSVRGLLMDTQLARIKLLLGTGAPSATLFATGSDAVVTQPFVCILTLEDQELLHDPLAATAFMLRGGGLEKLEKVRATAQIDSVSFLRFALDHEIYHCIDAYLHGPTRPETGNQLTAWYYDFRSEYSADMFASLRTVGQDANSEKFLLTLKTYRELSLGQFDVAHLTAGAIEVALASPGSKVRNMSISALAKLSEETAGRNLPSRQDYSRILAAALHIASLTGVVDDDWDDQGGTSNIPDARAVDVFALTRTLLRARKDVFGRLSD